ncbi:MAG TPA: hypothetical protein DIW64_11785 [Cellvibrio sp.]|nr:hypothetical protein [Cellvibrio sp.]
MADKINANFGTFNVLSIAPLQETLVQKNFVNYKAPRQIEELINVRPQIQEIFNKNETLAFKDVDKLTPAKFGVLGHIDPSRNMLVDALASIKSLRDQLKGNASFIAKAKTLFADIAARNDVEDLEIDVTFWDKFNTQNQDLAVIKYPINASSEETIQLQNVLDIPKKLDGNTVMQASSLYSAGLFSAGNTVRADIRDIDSLHGILMRLQSNLNRALTTKKNALIKLDQEIPERQRELANLDQARLKALGESKMVAALVEENWRKVEADYLRREKILTNHRGIYFARASETPVGKSTLLDVDLRYGKLEDLVPGTAISHLELPDDIEPYIETIADMPIVNWSFFNPYWNQLPARLTVLKWLDNRRLRLGYLARQPRQVASKFNGLMQSHQAILQDYARFTVVANNSLQTFYREAVQIISLEDLLTGSPHQLRGRAQHFRNQLDQATHLLLSSLQSVTPSLRLDWATAAELDQLDLRQPNSWPGMQQAKLSDLSEMRTLVELVSWWWRQLNENATSAAVTALRNLLRAALMVSVGDDPKEMLHGYLQAIPVRFRAGELVRATLNRHAAIGTELQLVNERDQLVGKLHVEDADERGAVLRIAQVYNTETVQADAQFALVGVKQAVRSFV